MFVWKSYTAVKSVAGILEERKHVKMLLLFGIIPLFISVTP